jgi:hypothetical protein
MIFKALYHIAGGKIMDTSKSEFLYSEMANMLNEIIPEVEPGIVNHYYCFYEADIKK